MGQAKGPAAYPAVREVLNRALERTIEKEGEFGCGIALNFPTAAKASAFRNQCYTVRMRERNANAKRYPEGHQNHGLSPWDHLSFTLEVQPDGTARLKIWVPVIDEDAIEIL